MPAFLAKEWSHATAHAALSMVFLWYDWNWTGRLPVEIKPTWWLF
jgi:hypothetical protein